MIITRDEISKIIENNDVDKFESIENIDIDVLVNIIISVKFFWLNFFIIKFCGIMFFASKIQKIAWKKLKKVRNS